jgi:DNA polymerase-3 subunit delta'
MAGEAVRSLNEVLGQAQAVGTLRASIASGRIHHAWIFTGPFGVGKRTAAEAFAAAILDPTTQPNLAGEYEPDPDSPTQRLIAEGRHPDVHVITKELARFAEDKRIREQKLVTIAKAVIDEHLLGPIARAPTLRTSALAGKVFIVDEAELLDRSRTNAPVQNSLLKTLEEPPAGSVIILVTSAEEMILPTIRSRCQRVVFRALDDRAMEAWLARSGLDVPGEERGWLLEFAGGSPGRALLAAQGRMFEWSRTLEPMLASADRARLAPTLGATMAKFIEDWAQQWVKDHPSASKESANIAGTRHLLGLLAERERRSMRESATADAPERLERSLRTLDAIDRAERHVAAHVTIANSMEALAAGLAGEVK